MGKFTIHPYARIFPPMDRAALDALSEDLLANGQQQPIIVTPKMEILDGLHRYRLMARMGMEMEHEVFEGTDEEALALVVSLNQVRRHLTTGQRAAVAAEVANMMQGRRVSSPNTPNGGASQADAAKQMNTSQRSVQRATKIKKEGDHDLFEAVKKGKMEMEDATKALKLPKEKQNEIARSKNPAKEVKKATAKKAPPKKSLLDKAIAAYIALSISDKEKFRAQIGSLDELAARETIEEV